MFHDATVSSSIGNSFACSDCHAIGEEQGDRIFSGGNLAGVVGRPSFWGGRENDLLRSVNDCRTFFMRAAEPWTGDEDDSTALAAYLESLSGSSGVVAFTPVRDIVPPPCVPADAARGERIFRAACEHCHGTAEKGQGRKSRVIPVLPLEVLYNHGLAGPCDEPGHEGAAESIFASKIRHGAFFAEGGTMAPFSPEVLSDTDVLNLFAFLGLGPSQ